MNLLDSRRADFDSLLQSFAKQNPGRYSDFVEREKKEIKYAYDNFIVMYPYHHSRITGIKKLSDDIINKRLANNTKELNKPDWVFPASEDYAKKGWVAVSFEYRLAYRHGTLPFESVMDAKSAVRWLRMHAGEYNIDTNRIVVPGNSTGGHLALCTALVTNWNDPGDNFSFSTEPNLILVNSGVHDLTDANIWKRQGLRESGRDEDLVKEISPVYLVREGLPPAPIIHGTNDMNVAFSNAETFVNEMKKAGNPVEFKVLEGAGHYIWFGEYSQQVSEIRRDFLQKYHYE